MPIYSEGQMCYDLRTEGAEIQMLLNDGTVVYIRDAENPGGLQHPQTKMRIVEEDGPNGLEKWFEFGFELPAKVTACMTGNSAAGFSIYDGKIMLHLERSEDLQLWGLGQMLPSPLTPESDGNPDPDAEILTHWARSIYPQDSAISTGQIWCESTIYNADARNNPFTSIIIADVIQPLPNYPYTMPGDAAQLQTDLQAAGWTGATVAAASDTLWRIEIPNVDFTGYLQQSKVYWPMYLVPNMYGDIVNPVDGRGFTGSYVNAGNVRTKIPKQFVRLGMRFNAEDLDGLMTGVLDYLAAHPEIN